MNFASNLATASYDGHQRLSAAASDKSTQIMPVQELLADPTDVVRVVSKINLAQQAAD